MRAVGYSTTEGGTKLCPDCAEQVKEAARVCRFCGYRFAASPEPEPRPDQPHQATAEARASGDPDHDRAISRKRKPGQKRSAVEARETVEKRRLGREISSGREASTVPPVEGSAGKPRVLRWVLAGLAVALGAVVFSWAGRDNPVELPVGDTGFTVQLPGNFYGRSPKEQWIAYASALADASGFNSAFEQCSLGGLARLPESRFEDEPLESGEAEANQLLADSSKGCGREIIQESATTEQVAFYKAVIGTPGLELVLADPYFSDRQELSGCILKRYEAQSDLRLIEFENGTGQEVGRELAQWSRECAEENP